MEAFSVPFNGNVVLVLTPDEAAQLRRMLLVEFFVEECVGRKVADAIERELLGTITSLLPGDGDA